MIRTLIGLLALCTLGACGVLGPTQADLQNAVQRFYADEHAGAPDLGAARIESYEGCQPLNGIYRCPVVFSTEGANVATLIWIARSDDGWQVRNIVLNEVPR